MAEKLTAAQKRAMDLMAGGARVYRGGGLGTRLRVNGFDQAIPARTLWSLVDRGLVEHRFYSIGGTSPRDVFCARRALDAAGE